MKTLNAATDLFEPIEVDLWGPRYSVRQPTRAVERKVEEAVRAVEALPEDATDEQTIEALAEILDVILEPLAGEDGKRTHAKTVIRKKYQDGQIGAAHVEALFERISAMRSDRPT